MTLCLRSSGFDAFLCSSDSVCKGSKNKGSVYIERLEIARCDSNWDAVPELIRKVRKHAPERECLALAAETECAISRATSSSARPSSGSTARDLDLPTRIPRLLDAIDKDRTNFEERFQARVCVGWLHWVVGEYSLAIVRLPKRLQDDDVGLDTAELVLEWTRVCTLKAAYLRANCLIRDGMRLQALDALSAAAPALNRPMHTSGFRKQLRYWSELFLTEFCMLMSDTIGAGEATLDDPFTLAPYRAWARYWEHMQAPITGGFGFKGAVPQRRVWNEYYKTLSRILEMKLIYRSGFVDGLPIPGDLPPRSQLRTELKYIETIYRSLLLTETSFPRANEERAEVEDFVKLCMQNWSILCGRGWQEGDLGQGGRVAISRGVLDTLFSAATRTYHSCSILRSLFAVHLSLAEFDLAFKAIDSYLEIVKAGRSRVDKTGEMGPNLDEDDAILQTMALGVMALCRYRHQQAGEKARRMGAELEDWLAKLPQTKRSTGSVPTIAEEATSSVLRPPVSPRTLALVWQAIGLSHARWARITHEAISRTEIQAKAIRCFRKSLATEFGRNKDIRSFIELALMLAERREISAAIELAKAVLMSSISPEEDMGPLQGAYWKERALIPLWHLLALLLSAKQDFASASRACEAALEQFKDPTLLFGRSESSFRSEHQTNEVDGTMAGSPAGLVDEMDDAEKESILEVKMTQLALIEVTEGPDVAVNASYELLALFSRLFGTAAMHTSRAPSMPAPKTSGTLRGLRQSIFGHRRERSKTPSRRASPNRMSVKTDAQAESRPVTAQDASMDKAQLQFTAENGQQARGPRSRRGSASHRPRSESGRRSSTRTKDGDSRLRTRSQSRHRSEAANRLTNQATVVDSDVFFTPGLEPENMETFSFLDKPPSHFARHSSATRGKSPSLYSTPSMNFRTLDSNELTAEITFAAPHLLPLVQLPSLKLEARRVSILIGVWLTIAGFYRRAGQLDNCRGAIAEAQKLVQGVETETLQEQANISGLQTAGWGESKGLDDLWADVWSELGHLSLAKKAPYTARSDFEHALVYSPDHPSAIVGLSNILLDIYSEDLLPPPSVPPLDGVPPLDPPPRRSNDADALPSCPLGLRNSQPPTVVPPIPAVPQMMVDGAGLVAPGATNDDYDDERHLPLPYKARRLPLVDRLTARDRAFALLSGLTRLGSGWDDAEAWFALARAHEESGQADRAKEMLWWCVELEEAAGVRNWRCLRSGGYTS